MEQRVSNNFIEQLVDKVTEGFHGDVGVIPRQFLREIVGVMDLVDEHDDFDPIKEYNFAPKGLTDAEQAAMEQKKLDEASAELDDDLVPTEDVW
jgi:hypothetical protein